MKKIIILINAILIFFLFSVINLNSEDYIINDLGYSINLKNLDYIKTFSIDEFENDVIIIGYDASGNGSDDWFCKNLHCTLTLIK